MAELVKNDKGFRVIKMSIDEAKLFDWGISDGLSYGLICLKCNKYIEGDIYYIPVLNDVMHKECYEKWLENATRYEEDIPYEEKAFKAVADELKLVY